MLHTKKNNDLFSIHDFPHYILKHLIKENVEPFIDDFRFNKLTQFYIHMYNETL